jgi:hypothetical protein
MHRDERKCERTRQDDTKRYRLDLPVVQLAFLQLQYDRTYRSVAACQIGKTEGIYQKCLFPHYLPTIGGLSEIAA